jgi:hypothetical protein
VQMHDGKNWGAISALVPGRKRIQCRNRWRDVLDTQPNDGATGRWTLDEDVKLTSAVTNASQKKYHGEYKIDWVGISELVPGRTREQCCDRWQKTLDPSIDRAPPGRSGKWTAVEDSKLKDAVQMHGGKDWAAITALVPDRTRNQCWGRWHYGLNPSVHRANGRTGQWVEDEDSKLKGAVQTHGGKNWDAVASLVLGRTNSQCRSRWHQAFDPSIDRASGRKGKWTAVEVAKLNDAVQTHGGNNWKEIAVLVPGRTNLQCKNRWYKALDPSIDRVSGRTCKGTADEDKKLKDAVLTHGGKDWAAITAQVPGRLESQCSTR